MSFEAYPYGGTVQEAIDQLTRKGSGYPLVVVAERFSREERPRSWVKVELGAFDDRLDVLTRLRRKHGRVVAVIDDERWDRAKVAHLIHGLMVGRRQTVFFTSSSTDLSAFALLIRRFAVVGRHDGTVTGFVHGLPRRRLRVVDILRTATPPIRALGAGSSSGPRVPAGARGLPAREPTGTPYKHHPTTAPRPHTRVRSVNTLIVPAGGALGTPVTALSPGADYQVLVNIGPHMAASLLAEPDAKWPAEWLPAGNLELRAVLTMAGTDPQVSMFTLPVAGTGPWVRLRITAPDREQLWTGELVIYHEVVAVHAQRLVLPVGSASGARPHAELLYRLTRSFEDLGPLSERTASVLVTEGGSRALVNGVRFADNPVWINANAADNAVRGARQLLHDQHLKAVRGGYVSTLNVRYGKDFPVFTEDLANLARQGAVIYDRLFRDNRVFDTLAELIRHEATARGRPAVLTVADPTVSDPDRAHPVPWSLVYDLRMPQDPRAEFRFCPSVRRYGPGGSAEPVPAHCPEPDHSGNVLCPFGFWGLSSVIEQPPSTDELVWHVFDDPVPPAVSVAVDPGLDDTLTRRHLTSLTGHDWTVETTTVSSAEQLAKALAGETMDIAYLYCHGGYHKLAVNGFPSPVLRFGSSIVDPVEVSNWRRDPALWPRPHWPRRKPLVVLNGCHTAELTTATLSNFVDAFANRAGAAGVLGTEVSVEQGMAGWVVEMLLRRLAEGASVGAALREVRWRMIGRGNVMGLAYTLYGASGLRLRLNHRNSGTEYSP